MAYQKRCKNFFIEQENLKFHTLPKGTQNIG